MAQLFKITWDEALSTGDSQLDSQHKVLIGIFNDLADTIGKGANKEDIQKILLALKHYAEWHFSCEEDCMEKYHCPMASSNKAAHAVFRRRLENYDEEFGNAENVAEFAFQVHDDLARWIYTHILEVDATLYHSIYPTNVPKDL